MRTWCSNTTGYYFDIQNVEVNTDNTIDFLIDRRGNYSSDATWFYPTITFEDADTIFDIGELFRQHRLQPERQLQRSAPMRQRQKWCLHNRAPARLLRCAVAIDWPDGNTQ